MTEEIKTPEIKVPVHVKPKRNKVHFIIMIIIFSITLVYINFVSYNQYAKNKKFESQNEQLTEKIKELITENAFLVNVSSNYKKEIDTTKKRFEKIKDREDLLCRDIFLYIDKHFQLIPRSLAEDIASQIVNQAKAANMSPELIVGIIEVESSFNPMAISSKNARGLMQVMPEWAKKFGLKRITDFHDVSTNIESGIKVLKIHIDEANGSITKGLYYYVGKSDTYSNKVYAAMGKFVAFRSTIDNDQEKGEEDNNAADSVIRTGESDQGTAASDGH